MSLVVKNACYKEIISNISFELEKSELLLLKGKNGSGKTTLLDCVSGINTKYTGDISGNDDILYQTQHLYFSNKLCFWDFIKFIEKINGDGEFICRLYILLENFNLKNRFEIISKKPIGMLSGGERKFFLFTILSTISRSYYIFDEPFAGIDMEWKELIVERIVLIQQTAGIILTTHELEPLKKIPDYRVLEIADGKIISSDE